VQRRGLRPAVDGGDARQDVVRPGLGVLDEHVEVAVLGEDAGIHQLVFHVQLAALPVDPHQLLVGEGPLRILVEHAHVGVGGRAVQVVVVLLDVFAVVALRSGQAEEPLFEDGVLPVPQRQGEAQVLAVVADAAQAILIPAVNARARLVVGEEVPGLPGGAIVLAHAAPGALAEIGPPAAPARAVVAQPGVFFRGISQPILLCAHMLLLPRSPD
jgi:hypothetical protein